MKFDTVSTLSPPWGSAPAWQEANFSIDFHIKRYYSHLGPVLQIAREACVRLESIFPALDAICRLTCPRCPAPCCLSASPWYDWRDLIFLHLNQLSIPPTQTISGFAETCCYISHKGCTLPRITRPWICTWYLCPAQTANLNARNTGQRKILSRLLGEIKALRENFEDAFIRVIS
ncbi:MAG: hypothetical protein JRH12_22865 [Deltaproteobacteria bacterium]|jgi:hypothetical protein|nr:hypothetical protein [Deltaproteobacteria bacterium]MBW2482465.1 hypothetical protein [Deltaproteobacteria bacterium]